MTATLASNWSSGILDPASAEIFTSGFVKGLGTESAALFYNVSPSSSLTIQNIGIDGPSAYQPRTDNEDIPLSDIAQRNSKTYTQTEHSNGFSVSHKARLFAEPAILGRFFSQLGAAAGQLMDEQMYDVITGGFSDTGPDGVSLFHASHPIDKTGATVSNTGTTALDFAALAAGRAALRRLQTSSGMKMRVEPKYLVCGPELADTAQQLVSSQYTSASLQTNTFMGALTVVVSSQIDDTDDWFLIGDQTDHHLRMYLGKGPTPEMRIDPANKALVMDDIVCLATGYDDFRGAFGASV